MNLILITVALASAFIAYVNGANDVSKGIATLVGGGITSYRRAIVWGALWTTAGGIAAFGFAGAMVATFGKGLLTSGVVPTLPAAVATILGAALWIALATRFGLPVSTTHAIVGSIAGVTAIAYGLSGMKWSIFGAKIALPLVLSPIVSLIITSAVLQKLKGLSSLNDCLCAETVSVPLALATAPAGLAIENAIPSVRVVGCKQGNRGREHPDAVPITLNQLHWLTSASTSFARGLNDAPKMVALLLAAATISGYAIGSSFFAYLLIALGILSGSLTAGLRVTTALAEKITPMNHLQGFVANLITASLVGPGAALGLPMSTTHVASAAIIGVGLQQHGKINWQTVRNMVLAWVVTLPGAAMLGIVSYELLLAAGMG